MISPTRSIQQATSQPSTLTPNNEISNINNIVVSAGANEPQDDEVETRIIPFPNSSSNTPPVVGTPNSMELIDPSIMADREASMHVTGWVRANYIQEREHNVPRRNMFEHYKAFCTSTGLTPVNSATFGKLLRVVFPELKTRRLGVRGQSKYHYCGIRVRLPEDIVAAETPNMAAQAAAAAALIMNQPFKTASPASSSNATTPQVRNAGRYTRNSSSSTSSQPQAQQQPTPTSPIPTFSIPNIGTPGAGGYQNDHALAVSFTAHYERHCRDVFNLISTNQVDKLKNLYMSFYNDMPEEFIHLIRSYPEITEACWRWDCTLYDTMILTFLPTVNHPLSQDTVKCLRTYTRELREYIEANLNHYPSTFYQKKADVARIFSAKFRRQLSLNFAAQTASTILSMQDHLLAMRHDWEQFDFDGILDQTLWICDCDTNEIRQTLRQEVYELLTTKPSLEHWMHWMSQLVNKYLKRFEPTNLGDANHYLNRSKQLLLKWNFYTCLIMKDLTLQQARSFGSFHSIKIFLDDYLLYLVEENIAAVNYQMMQQQHEASAQGVRYGACATTATS